MLGAVADPAPDNNTATDTDTAHPTCHWPRQGRCEPASPLVTDASSRETATLHGAWADPGTIGSCRA
jgi:hypothetical protein